jgi:hypothetical protein
VLFASSCFRLVWVDPGWGLATGEGLFTLLGGVALVGWFIATPYNSGPPFLIASLIVPVIAGLIEAVELRREA